MAAAQSISSRPRRSSTKQERETRPRPGVEQCYPGEKSLRFRAALAGARLARYLEREGAEDFAERLAEVFALDRLNDVSDVASFEAERLAKYVTAADARIRALREQRRHYLDHIGAAIDEAREKYERGLRRKGARSA